MATRAGIDTTQRELSYRKRLIEIANLINSAPSIQDILVDIKDKMLDLVEAERVTIFALDTKNQELFSLFKAGQEVKEIRVPKTFGSIAGFAALSRRTANVKNAYDPAELARLHPNLKFDSRWDRASGFHTTQILSSPILFDKYLLGVLELLNKRGGGQFTPKDEEAAGELAKILGIAFYNQHRAARSNRPSKYGLLIDKGLVSEKDLEKAISNARVNQVDVAKILEEDLKIPKEEVGRALAQFYSCAFWEPLGRTIPEDLKGRLTLDFLKKNVCAPIERKEGTLLVAVEDPYDLTRQDSIKAMNLAPRCDFVVGLRGDILEYIHTSYGVAAGAAEEQDLGRIIMELGSGEEDELEGHEPDPSAPPEVDETDSGIVKLANQIIIDAYNRGASDIHIEPYGKTAPTQVRLRIDGDCVKYLEIPAPHRNAIVQRFKIMSKLDIAEKRKPQDGKIRFKGPMGSIELRVATIPTSGSNEDVVMRLLAASKPLPLEKMGFLERNLSEFKRILQKPYGICLVVGPTGSGKTTTLHSGLGFINTTDMKIWTAEDPVEITQPGLRQVQVHPKIDFTFAIAMRAFLRADPDVIMVGEMRDHETAATGIEASLTGHLVFSTLHTNSAPETITRLLDMEIDPFNFADALLGIMAQRLVRTLCKDCKEEYAPTQEEFAELMQEYGLEAWEKLGVRYSPSFRLGRPKGCPKCGNTGYRGRMGIHELLVATDDIKRKIQKREPIEELRKQAVRDGMTTLLQDGIQKVLLGVTDFKQVRAVCIK
ncbi:MAG TPA: ATPase, T2SS/T4P/T4SS family [Vicinamibacteria bacterium]|jgi:type II secretory ATPase GspE/PulE/Tfp pilus assembly ATPase PilB-like protein|nr:ATPase, T2SS/T4P/T4SS family [Vicinamibacteria bacterium]